MRLNPEIKILIFIAIVVGFSFGLESFYSGLINSGWFMPFVTLLVGSFVVYLYLKQKQDFKKNAAKIILQEIRRAEDIIFDYKEHGGYQFTKKIIAINSWGENIHHFVDDLSVDELDKISNLYSIGEYLDSVIVKVSDFNFKKKVEEFEKKLESIQKKLSIVSSPQIQESPQSEEFFEKQIESGEQIIKKPISTIKLPVQISAPWKELLDEVTYKYEPIYHSNICEKLRKIAKIN